MKNDTKNSKFKKLEILSLAKDFARYALMARPNVIGLDLGKRIKNGKVYDEDVIKVYVSVKLDKSLLKKDHLVPAEVTFRGKKFLTDVEEGPQESPLMGFSRRNRPVVGGSSISTVGSGGTLGVCLTLNNGNTYGLSNNHVLADTNNNPIGTPIYQPSFRFGGTTNDEIGTLSKIFPIDFGSLTITIRNFTTTIPNPNKVDAALMIFSEKTPGNIDEISTGQRNSTEFNNSSREIYWVGYPKYKKRAKLGIFEKLFLIGRKVVKMGASSNYTIGTITSVNYDILVGPYRGGNIALFIGQIRIEGDNGPFAIPGDSGSLVVDAETNEPIGLLFSAGGNRATANPIFEVMDALQIPQI